jgi:phosphatidylserine/phosphatidylglycerophosphate/cardiolipin synthase-like enzyme
MFERMLSKFIGTGTAGDSDAAGDSDPAPTGLVLSLPAPVRTLLESRLPGLLPTAGVFGDLLASAREEVKIFSPYVDPSFTGLVQACRVPVKVVTTLRDAKMKASPVLERLAAERTLSVRYLHEAKGKTQMFQMHAKMIVSDRRRAYIGSANFTDTSLHYNLEMGLCITDKKTLDGLHILFDHVFENVARPASQI